VAHSDPRAEDIGAISGVAFCFLKSLPVFFVGPKLHQTPPGLADRGLRKRLRPFIAALDLGAARLAGT
jgi:hypothetical protein